jgi:hypothetical protein
MRRSSGRHMALWLRRKPRQEFLLNCVRMATDSGARNVFAASTARLALPVVITFTRRRTRSACDFHSGSSGENSSDDPLVQKPICERKLCHMKACPPDVDIAARNATSDPTVKLLVLKKDGPQATVSNGGRARLKKIARLNKIFVAIRDTLRNTRVATSSSSGTAAEAYIAVENLIFALDHGPPAGLEAAF